MSGIREPVEWVFKEIGDQFGFLNFTKNQKLLLQPVGLYYLVAVPTRIACCKSIGSWICDLNIEDLLLKPNKLCPGVDETMFNYLIVFLSSCIQTKHQFILVHRGRGHCFHTNPAWLRFRGDYCQSDREGFVVTHWVSKPVVAYYDSDPNSARECACSLGVIVVCCVVVSCGVIDTSLYIAFQAYSIAHRFNMRMGLQPVTEKYRINTIKYD
jgi:hypothetical protein